MRLIEYTSPVIGPEFIPFERFTYQIVPDGRPVSLKVTVYVISTNSINVINGKFSAVVNFKPVSQSGRLDVYSTDPNGKEINLIEIPVNFN